LVICRWRGGILCSTESFDAGGRCRVPYCQGYRQFWTCLGTGPTWGGTYDHTDCVQKVRGGHPSLGSSVEASSTLRTGIGCRTFMRVASENGLSEVERIILCGAFRLLNRFFIAVGKPLWAIRRGLAFGLPLVVQLSCGVWQDNKGGQIAKCGKKRPFAPPAIGCKRALGPGNWHPGKRLIQARFFVMRPRSSSPQPFWRARWEDPALCAHRVGPRLAWAPAPLPQTTHHLVSAQKRGTRPGAALTQGGREHGS